MRGKIAVIVSAAVTEAIAARIRRKRRYDTERLWIRQAERAVAFRLRDVPRAGNKILRRADQKEVHLSMGTTPRRRSAFAAAPCVEKDRRGINFVRHGNKAKDRLRIAVCVALQHTRYDLPVERALALRRQRASAPHVFGTQRLLLRTQWHCIWLRSCAALSSPHSAAAISKPKSGATPAPLAVMTLPSRTTD